MTKWKKVEGESIEDDENSKIWKPDTPDEWISGEYFDKDENIGLHNDSNLYHIKSEDGIHYKVWGSMILDDLMGKVGIGQEVKIVYKGKRQGKKNFYKVFEVFEADNKEDEDKGEQSPTSSSSQSRRPVAGKLRFEANGYVEDARHNLIGKGDLEPGLNDLKKELKEMYRDKCFQSEKFTSKQLYDASVQLVEDAHKEYEELLE